jgi:hypothetical protein
MTAMKPDKVAGIVAAAVLIGSVWVGICGWGVAIPKDAIWPAIKIAETIILLCWTVLPPVWFWLEYYYVYKPPKDARPRDDFESFKYGQDISSKIWLSVVSALLILYFGKDLRG